MRPFGYDFARQIRPDEADLIREAARRVIDGETVGAVERDWNDRGIVTTGGRAWAHNVLKRSLQRPTLAGLAATPDGDLVESDTPAILDRDTWQQVQDLIAANQAPSPPADERTYLLTGGIARCGICQTPLRASPIAGRRNYRCTTAAGGCGKIRVDGDGLDEFVQDEVTARLPQKRTETLLRQLEQRAEAGKVELDAMADRRRAIRADNERGRTTSEQARAAMQREDERVAAARQVVRAAETLRDVLTLTSDELLTWWDTASLDLRRALVAALLESVDVSPATRRGHFDTDRLSIRWR